MSWRVTLDHSRAGNDFNVPADGSMDLAVEKYGFMAPLKLFFRDRVALADWWQACCRVYPVGPTEPDDTYWPPNAPSGFYQLQADGDGYRDVTGSWELTRADYADRHDPL